MNRRLRRQQKKQARRTLKSKGPLEATDVRQVLSAALAAMRAGDARTAVDLSLRVLETAPDNGDAVEIAGHSALHLDDPDAALSALQRLVELVPARATLHNDYGGLLAQRGDYAAAEAAFRRALELDPDNTDALTNLGFVLTGTGQFDAAEEAYDRAIQLDPRSADAHNSLGILLEQMGRIEDALAAYQRAQELAPGDEKIRGNYVRAMVVTGGNLNERERLCRERLEEDPGDPKLLIGLAGILWDRGHMDQAFDIVNGLVDAGHDDPQVFDLLAELQFCNGDFGAAFDNFEHRFWRSDKVERPHQHPFWAGEDLTGKTLLVWGEQGIGDEIMFASLLPVLAATGAKIILESARRLTPVFARSFPQITCVPRETPADPAVLAADIDFQIAAGSLPRFLWRDFQNTPRGPFLEADAQRRREFRDKYRAGEDVRLVGISWRSINPQMGRQKSMTLDELIPVLSLPNVRAVDLQYGETPAERAEFTERTGIPIIHDDSFDQTADLDTLSAQIAALDHVVSISNTSAHFAAGLGVSLSLLLSTMHMWRWGTAGEKSFWYRDPQLLRQDSHGDWSVPVARAVAALTDTVPPQ